MISSAVPPLHAAPLLLSEILGPAIAGFSSSVRPPALARGVPEWYVIVAVLDGCRESSSDGAPEEDSGALRGDRGLHRDAVRVEHVLRLLGLLPQLRQRLPDVVDALQRVVRAFHPLRLAHQHRVEADLLPGLHVAYAVVEENLQGNQQSGKLSSGTGSSRKKKW